MRRVLAALVVAAGMVVALTLLIPGSSSSPDHSGPTAIQTAMLGRVDEAVVPPKVKFVRTIFAASSLKDSDLMLDFCKGPIAVDVGADRPVLVAEHDYCGGLEWMPKLGKDDAIKLSGDGVEAGTYVVRTIQHAVRREATVRDLPDTDIVLQTCVSVDRMVLVGMDLLDPSLQS
jgi:hypothetical protein